MSSAKGRIAYCTVPKIGGTYNFYRNLRAALVPRGWDVLAPVVGKPINALWDRAFPDDGCVPLAPDEADVRKSAQILVEWCDREKIDVFIPMSVEEAVSAVPHLPASVRTVMRCNNITRHTYDIVTAHMDRVYRVVATSQRQFGDLLNERHVPKDKLVLIPHGTDMSRFEEAFQGRRHEPGPIRIGYMGRLEESSKRVFLLPKVADWLNARNVDFRLTIIGDGPDRKRLESRLQAHLSSGRAKMVGAKPHREIPGLLGEIDIFVMPSAFEGFPNSLLEAMAAGVVPVVSRIAGVTDWIVNDRVTGFVCPIGNAKAFGESIERLANDRSRLAAMSRAAHDEVARRFNLNRLGDDYENLFNAVLAQPRFEHAPKPWSEFEACPAFRPTFRRWIPEGLKGRLRGLLESWRTT